MEIVCCEVMGVWDMSGLVGNIDVKIVFEVCIWGYENVI